MPDLIPPSPSLGSKAQPLRKIGGLLLGPDTRLDAKAVAEACELSGLTYKAGTEERVMRFVGSDNSVDRDNEIVLVSGWDLKPYKANPVVLWMHDAMQPPVGAAIEVSKGETSLDFAVAYATEDENPFADTIFRLLKARYLRAVSAGFGTKKARWVEAAEEVASFGAQRPFFLREKNELYELSNVTVPANPNALAAALSGKDFDRELVRKAFGVDQAEARLRDPHACLGFDAAAKATEADRLFAAIAHAGAADAPLTPGNFETKALLVALGVDAGATAEEIEAFAAQQAKLAAHRSAKTVNVPDATDGAKAGRVFSGANLARIQRIAELAGELLEQAVEPDAPEDVIPPPFPPAKSGADPADEWADLAKGLLTN